MAGGTTNRAGDLVTPGSADWQNARLLIAKDTAGAYRIVGVDADGRLLTDAELTVGEVKIGAVEIEDNESGLRADVVAAGGLDSLAVTSGTLATQATLAAVLAGLGPLATQATLATRASEATVATLGTQVTLAAIQTLVTNVQAVIDAAAPASVQQVGGQIKTGVPAEGVNNALVPLLLTSFRELITAGYNRAMAAQDNSPVSAAKIPAIIEDGWVALTAAGDETPPRDTRLYATHTVAYDITIGSLTSMDLIVWGSIDGTLWFPLAAFNVLAAGVLEDSIRIEAQVTFIKCELEAENGAADGSVVFQLTSGNKA